MEALTWSKIKQFLFTPKFTIRNVIYAVLLGFLIAYLTLICVYGVSGGNHILKSLFEQDFLNSKSTSSLFNKMVVLGFAGLAVAFGMKAGILNIGVSGQMTAGGFLGYLIISKTSWMQNVANNNSVLVLMFFIVIGTSILTALLSGVLKAFFKVNEVISTIMINWIVVYFIKTRTTTGKKDAMQVASGTDSKGNLLFSDVRFVEGNEWIFTTVAIIMFAIVAIATWVFLAKTKGGFKLIATGKNLSAAKYSGYNSKGLLLLTFAISGLFAGLAGYIYFFLSYNSIPGMEAVIQEGFMGIAVALVAMVNPIAVIPAAILFGLLTGPIDGIVVAGFAPNSVQVFSGVITYFVAITTLFMYLRPLDLLRNAFYKYKFRNELRIKSPSLNQKLKMSNQKITGGDK